MDVSDIQLLGTATPRAITPDDDLNHAGVLLFSAPDGHPWAAQQITARP
ncbi:hypothetical protein LAJ19_00565 [Deinococcus taeanensis]|nr:hypothetical protein [Deinococcus taeanensis]UBV42765.1 hypothetical protein LAJ19_00565 [Deinococcus taeanensis]